MNILSWKVGTDFAIGVKNEKQQHQSDNTKNDLGMYCAHLYTQFNLGEKL